jgi:uncharacterized protein DUF2183
MAFTTTIRAAALAWLTLGVMSGLARAADSFVLVSDVDDTVKITDVLHPAHAVEHAVFSEAVFAGMPELYHQLLGNDSPPERLRFMSGSPFFLKHKVHELLDEAPFPSYDLTLRGPKELRTPPFGYKMKRMNDLYSASGDCFLLVGDDTEMDPEVYRDFAAPRPKQVLAIYIHRITGRPVPDGSFEFVTAYDVAMHEYLAGRLNEEQAAIVGDVVLASRYDSFLPDFQACPNANPPIPDLPVTLARLEAAIEGRLTTSCSGRANWSRSH